MCSYSSRKISTPAKAARAYSSAYERLSLRAVSLIGLASSGMGTKINIAAMARPKGLLDIDGKQERLGSASGTVMGTGRSSY